MIDNYDDDIAMAKYGRYCAKQKAIREAKETIRDCTVRIGNSVVLGDIVHQYEQMHAAITVLIDTLKLD